MRLQLPPFIHTKIQHQTLETLAFRCMFRPTLMVAELTLRTLQRYFRKSFGLTVTGWLRELRLRMAYEHLQSAHSVKEAAYELGYKQPSHFSRDFKNQYGVPPSALCTSWRLPAPVLAIQLDTPARTATQLLFAMPT